MLNIIIIYNHISDKKKNAFTIFYDLIKIINQYV